MRSRAAVVAGAAGVVLAGWLAWVVVDHAGKEVYDLPRSAVVIGLAGAGAAAAGWLLVAWRRDGLVLGATLASLLLVAGVLALMSIGILLLIGFGASVVFLIRRAARRDRPVSTGFLLAAAVLVGIGLPAAGLVARSDPVVTCLPNGAAGSSSIFRPSGSGSSSGMAVSGSAADGSGGGTSGEISAGDRHYRYRCEGDQLVEFEVEDRSR